jgi:hypothetical protein
LLVTYVTPPKLAERLARLRAAGLDDLEQAGAFEQFSRADFEKNLSRLAVFLGEAVKNGEVLIIMTTF